MQKLDEIKKQIDNLRKQMHLKIEQSDNLINPAIIETSQLLDDELNKYYKTY